MTRDRRRGDRHARAQGEARRRAHVTPASAPPPPEPADLPSQEIDPPDLPELLASIDGALQEPHPMALLELVSTMVASLEPDVDPMAREQDADGPTLDDIVTALRGTALRQTDAVLLVLAEMLPDPDLRTQLRREVAQRRHALPGWLLRAERIRPVRAALFADVLGDGDDVVLEIELPTRRALTLVVYIDTNLGTIVKTAFAIASSLEDVIEIHHENAVEGQTVEPLSLADARARIEEAVAAGRATFPPVEDDEWPALRPFTEWMARLLPEGGSAPQWEEPTQAILERYRTQFFASPHARGLDGSPGSDARSIVDMLMSFGSSQGTGDPLRVSPVTTEILLLDWVPRKVVADVAYLDQVPTVHRGFVRFAHEQRGVPAERTRETLAALDQLEPEYRTIIRSPRHQGPMALLERLGAIPPAGPDGEPPDQATFLAQLAAQLGPEGAAMLAQLGIEDPAELDTPTWLLRRLANDVGGREALDTLDIERLPLSEQLVLDGVPADIHDRLRRIDALLAPAAASLYGEELRTAARRVLARVAVGDPAIFRRRSKDDTTAAAVLWIAAKVNREVAYGETGLLAEAFGLTAVPVQRATPMLRALGVEDRTYWSYDAALGDPDLLTSERRLAIVQRRDDLLDWIEGDEDD
ncbi:hypothetical protein [Miniimonas sp. S16]|uniref:hypothetical protein n=1 Tax=Miniimonas sp. S16 TaxID=2171623 RepID=UPI000D5259BB|nr:hypothetical protein [Miniimonas sp. S16]